MNERIRALAEQATELDYETFDNYNHKTVQHYKFNKEKFALLLVQECIDIIAPYSVRMSRPGEEYLHPILEIKQHFGVEE